MEKEYVVTARSKDDLQSLYNDLESTSSSATCPSRQLHCCKRRHVSRNTHYMLTDAEAEQLRSDPRVIAVELSIREQPGIEIVPHYTQESNRWYRGIFTYQDENNWGIYRSFFKTNPSHWGNSISDSVTYTNTGKNVDVVIVDGHIDPNHPEFAKNADGTGGTRVNHINWLQWAPQVTGGSAGTYNYTPYTSTSNERLTSVNNHGMHCAGTAAGNSQGWARDSTIYNISPYSGVGNSIPTDEIFDYIRYFHAIKPVNPETGVKNPTVANNSWGFSQTVELGNVNYVRFRGNDNYATFSSFSESDMNGFGVRVRDGNAIFPFRNSGIDADYQDAIAEGVIMVEAAGNDNMKVDSPGGIDWNNFWNPGFGSNFYYNRGASPRSTGQSISVGASDYATFGNTESKASFSNTGPGVFIYSPGTMIMSSVHPDTPYSRNTTDLRDETYRIAKISGTSMASPQVSGMIACFLEHYPRYNIQQVKDYLAEYSMYGQINDNNGPLLDSVSLQGSVNRISYYHRERPDTGMSTPKMNYEFRPSTGRAWPRVTPRRYKT